MSGGLPRSSSFFGCVLIVRYTGYWKPQETPPFQSVFPDSGIMDKELQTNPIRVEEPNNGVTWLWVPGPCRLGTWKYYQWVLAVWQSVIHVWH